MPWLVIAVLSMVTFATGYLTAVCTSTPFLETVRERQRIEREARLAELQLRHLSHQAMQGLLREARQR